MPSQPHRNVFVLLPLLLCAGSSLAIRYYVDANATGANDGSSWSNAFLDPQSAFAVALAGDEVWVAAAVYKPTTGTDRSISFEIPSGVAVYGGFAGGESDLAERDWEAHVTVLSGDIGVAGDKADNSTHVVRMAEGGTGMAIDGFTIAYGFIKSGDMLPLAGVGVLNVDGALELRNCTIRENEGSYGAAVANIEGGSLTMENCRLVSNHGYRGGGLLNDASEATIRASYFSNTVTSRGGSIRNQSGARCVIENSVVHGTAWWGGAISSENADVFLSHVTLGGRAEIHGGGIHHVGGAALELSDVIFDRAQGFEGGGGLFVGEVGQVELTDVLFDRCQTVWNTEGGAAMRARGGEVRLTRVRFFKNDCYSSHEGGGALLNNGATLVAVNCTFEQNQAEWGGAIDNRAGALTLINCSFFGNVAQTDTPEEAQRGRGGAIWNRSVEPILAVNTIFWGDSATYSASEIFHEGSATAEFSHCLLAGSGASGAGWDPTLGVDAGGNWDLDPLYANAIAGDLTLLPSSVLINAGRNDALPPGTSVDLAGNPRIVGPAVDIGAYEWQGSVRSRLLSLSELKRRFGME